MFSGWKQLNKIQNRKTNHKQSIDARFCNIEYNSKCTVRNEQLNCNNAIPHISIKGKLNCKF